MYSSMLDNYEQLVKRELFRGGVINTEVALPLINIKVWQGRGRCGIFGSVLIAKGYMLKETT